jgi:hypothetical protein
MSRRHLSFVVVALTSLVVGACVSPTAPAPTKLGVNAASHTVVAPAPAPAPAIGTMGSF